MKKLQLKQNSPEWLEYRRLKIGASDCPIIMSGTPSQKKALWKEKHEGISRYSTPAMINGSRYEGEALNKFNEIMGVPFASECFERPEHPWMLASLDGYDAISGLHVEVKCPSNQTNFEKLVNEIPDRYIWQLQHQMAVLGTKECFFVVYNSVSKEISIQEVIKKEEMIEQLLCKEADYYYNHLLGFETPVF